MKIFPPNEITKAISSKLESAKKFYNKPIPIENNQL